MRIDQKTSNDPSIEGIIPPSVYKVRKVQKHFGSFSIRANRITRARRNLVKSFPHKQDSRYISSKDIPDILARLKHFD
jgi:regulator of PEP synthase PpsR (kinase-PPPase family)